MIELALPWPPSVNHYWAPRRGGGVRVSDEGRAYQERARVAVAAQRAAKASGRLSVCITAHPPDRRRRDLDNLGKAVLDSLQACEVIRDDGDIDDLRFIRAYPMKGGRLWVSIQEL